jgi:tyrosinase
MATYIRANAWNNGGTFANNDLLWYAKGVGAMQARALDDPASWWFFAAIHGEYVTAKSLADPFAFPWKNISPVPVVPTTPQPNAAVLGQYWDQCQHQSWYFPPWHRGYLIALEAQIRADVIRLGGPSTWALPYWNYFGPGDEFKMPAAFAMPYLPDGSPNPLLVTARYGPDSDGNIYVPTPAGIALHPNDPNFSNGKVTQDCMNNDMYTGSDNNTKVPGFGGPATSFSHAGGTSGNLEDNPHNLVHVYVGGISADGTIPGLMSDPGLAALDPIFYLHHTNIDRMWAEWNSNSANKNPTDQKWLDGPAGSGDRAFVMPMPGSGTWAYSPEEVDSLGKLSYTYDSLAAVVAPVVPARPVLEQRLARLGATAATIQKATTATQGTVVELVGASPRGVPVEGVGAVATIRLNPDVRRKVSASLALARETAAPDRVFLNLENVRGTQDSSVLSVYINLPEGAAPEDHPDLLAGSVGLFGLHSASFKDGKHGGEGLNFVLDITKIVDTLHVQNALDVDSLQVRIVPNRLVPSRAKITVGRISIYRQGN